MDVLEHVSPLQPQPQLSNDLLQAKPTLLPLFQHIALKIESTSESQSDSSPVSKLVILDDITSLEWIGFSLPDITRFTRALRALCLRVKFPSLINAQLSRLLTMATPPRSTRRCSSDTTIPYRTNQTICSAIYSSYASTTWMCVPFPAGEAGPSAGR